MSDISPETQKQLRELCFRRRDLSRAAVVINGLLSSQTISIDARMHTRTHTHTHTHSCMHA
jgi:hypothetical protein